MPKGISPDNAPNRNGKLRKLDINLDAYLKKRYGITLAQRDALISDQDGRCAICKVIVTYNEFGKRGARKTSACVDHDHRTGRIRGILCNVCNTAIGFFGDSTGVVRSALHYLEKNKNAQIPTV